MNYRIEQVQKNKKAFLSLLLVGDEQETMIDRYLQRGELFVLYENEAQAPSGILPASNVAPCGASPLAVAVVTNEGGGVFELKNLAVSPHHQRRGIGRFLVDFLCRHYGPAGEWLIVGTGESQATTSFYASCGFAYSHRIPHFFIENYDHPIVEEGKMLDDMLYFKRCL